MYTISVRVRPSHLMMYKALRTSLHFPTFWSDIGEGIEDMRKLMSW